MEGKDFRTQPITAKIFTRADFNEAYEIGKKAGINEVVDWLEANSQEASSLSWKFRQKMQAKLKEWGLSSGDSK